MRKSQHGQRDRYAVLRLGHVSDPIPLPSAILRGERYGNGSLSGIAHFTVHINSRPSVWHHSHQSLHEAALVVLSSSAGT
jgi:hypothetical protein